MSCDVWQGSFEHHVITVKPLFYVLGVRCCFNQVSVPAVQC